MQQPDSIQAASASASASPTNKNRYSCDYCRKQHRKCDKTMPRCIRCTQSGRACIYSNNEARQAAAAARSDITKKLGHPKKPRKEGATPEEMEKVEEVNTAAAPEDMHILPQIAQCDDSSVVALSEQTQQISQEFSCLSLIENMYFGVLSLGHPMTSMSDFGTVLMHHFRGNGNNMDTSIVSSGSDIRDYHCALVHSIIALCLQRMGHRTAAWASFERADSVAQQLLSTHFPDGAGIDSTWYRMVQARREDMRMIVFSIITMARFLLGTGRHSVDANARRNGYLRYAMSFLDANQSCVSNISSCSSSPSISSSSTSLEKAHASIMHAAGMLSLFRLSEQSICCRSFSSIQQAILHRIQQDSSAEKYPHVMVALFASLGALVTEAYTYESLDRVLAALNCIQSIFLQGQTLRMQQTRTSLLMEVRYVNWCLGSCTTWLYCLYDLLSGLDQHCLHFSCDDMNQARNAIYQQLDLVGERYQAFLDEKCAATLLAFCEPECAVYIASVLRYHLDRVIKSRLSQTSGISNMQSLPLNIAQHLVNELRALKMLRERFDYVQQEYDELIQLTETTLQLMSLEGNVT